MYKHILVPTDGSPLSLKAAKEATALAKKVGAKLTAVFVTEPFMPPANNEAILPRNMDTLQTAYRKSMEANALQALDKVAATAKAARVPCERLHVTNDRPWEGIIRAAKKEKCDLIVMASHGRKGLAGLLIGSETTKVLTHSKTPVLVCR
jgi:nucleotide-binding universal stress UspA family protein